MIENAFIGKLSQPTARELAGKLGPAKDLWNDVVSNVTGECGITDKEWNCYSPKAGWSLRLKQKKRNIVYLAPCDQSFRVAFILGEKAMKVAKNTQFPAKYTKLIAEAIRYPEGSAIRFEVTNHGDVAFVKQLAKIKVEN
ncbi:MAG TPA: DUF3788 family protein [Terriglobales bacterium]|nr:DUF3788 family protein [Terriglobales bacterium]